MDPAPGYYSDGGEEFKMLKRGNRAVSEGRLQFVGVHSYYMLILIISAEQTRHQT